jgi:tetratricopeptide (TPR) repeat protein
MIGRDGRTRRAATSFVRAAALVGVAVVAWMPAAAFADDASSRTTQRNDAELAAPTSAERDRWLAEGDRLEQEGKYDAARAAYIEADRVRPNDPTVLARRADLELRRGNPREAITLYGRTLALRPGYYDFRVGLARALAADGRFEASIREWEGILESHPLDYIALLGAAQTSGWGGKFDKAIIFYERLLTHHASSIEGLLGLASVLAWNDEFERSMDIYKRGFSSSTTRRFWRGARSTKRPSRSTNRCSKPIPTTRKRSLVWRAWWRGTAISIAPNASTTKCWLSSHATAMR